MKSLVVYYSHYGNTAYVADKFSDALRKYGETRVLELEYSGGKKNLATRLLYRLIPSLVKISPIASDLKDYDVLCLGIPVVAGYPPAAVAKYINTCKNLDNKEIICCYVYGIEASAKSCSKFVERVLQRRGSPAIISMGVPWSSVHDEQFLNKAINEAIEKITPNPSQPKSNLS